MNYFVIDCLVKSERGGKIHNPLHCYRNSVPVIINVPSPQALDLPHSSNKKDVSYKAYGTSPLKFVYK